MKSPRQRVESAMKGLGDALSLIEGAKANLSVEDYGDSLAGAERHVSEALAGLTELMRPSNIQVQLDGVGLIAVERQRQRDAGYTAVTDDIYSPGLLATAGVCYLDTATVQLDKGLNTLPACYVHKRWPFTRHEFRPSADPKRNLVKAGALIAAEIDREIRRCGCKAKGGGQ